MYFFSFEKTKQNQIRYVAIYCDWYGTPAPSFTAALTALRDVRNEVHHICLICLRFNVHKIKDGDVLWVDVFTFITEFGCQPAKK